MVVGGGSLLVSSSRGDAPSDRPRAGAGVDAAAKRERAPSKRTAQRHHSAKKPPKAALKTARKKARTAQRKPARAASSHHRKGANRAARKPRAAPIDESTLDAVATPDEGCHVQLRKAGVSFAKLDRDKVPDVRLPIRLTGSVAGIEIRGTGKNRATSYLDCRLALALVRWGPRLSAAGVVRLDHYSMYRPDAEVGTTGKTSGHAQALAIDAARFHLSDGRVLTVLETWTDKTKGADPCTPRPQHSADERLLRELVCDAARAGIFQTIVTPHHNPEHDNHVHLEVSSTFAPTWIH
jgi:hypothetical protein